MKKEFLFKYLHAKRVSVEASADKSVFVAAVLQLWGSPAPVSVLNIEEDSLPEAPAPSRNTSYSSLCSLDYGSQVSWESSFSSIIEKKIIHRALISAATDSVARIFPISLCHGVFQTHVCRVAT